MRNFRFCSISASLLADTLALVTFAFAVGMFAEVVVSGLSIFQSLQSRLMAIPLNTAVARPYGMYRDWLFFKTRAREKGRLAPAAVDIFALWTFMMPQYAAVLFFVGAAPAQILTACLTVSVLMSLIGRPYGLYLELWRRVFGLVEVERLHKPK
jgi:hypothetical protein